ncbi:restriction endonuclease subunit S [Flavobacterium psychrophilum]
MELVQEKFKQTEIGLIPSDWKILNLGKSSTLKARIGWQGLTTAEYLKNGDFYLITGTDFLEGYIDWDNCVYVEKERFDQDRNIQVKVDDILVTKDGTIGKVAFIDKIIKQTTLNSGVFVVRPTNKAYNSRYLYFILMSEFFKDFLNRLAAGSTISHLYQKDFVHFNMPLPSLKEQTLIATALSNTDTWITNLENLLIKKHQIKQGALQELLKPKQDWEVKKLEDVGEIITGSTPSTGLSEYWNGSIPWITPTDIKTNKNIFKSEREITESGLNVIRKLPKDTLLVTCIASIGKNTILRKAGACNQQINAIIPNSSNNVDFLYYLIENSKNYILGKAGITATLMISKKDFSQILFSFPNVKEQTRIATILSDMDVEIEQLETKLEKAKKVKQGMMQELLTGKTRLV